MARYSPELHELVAPVVESMGFELVGIEYHANSKNGLLRVYIDSGGGITVDDCAAVSHQVSGLLDVEDPVTGRYTLEVSSPGLDRPLFVPEHYRRFVGSKVALKLIRPIEGRAGRKLTGVIVSAEEARVSLEAEGVIVVVPLENVDTARIVPDF